MQAAEQDRPDVAAARQAWFDDQPDLDPDRLILLDETAATTTMARRHGPAPRGERCRLAVPLGQRHTTTLSAALRTTGLVATTVFEGATNGQRFRGTVADTLVPTLQPGDTVVLDTLPVHKVTGVREAVEAAGARLLFLPPYRPDFNPIENAFAKLKARLRTAAARTVEDLHQATHHALACFTPQECRNYVTAAGYENDIAVLV